MRISYNWIKELLPELDLSPAEVARLLTMHSFETEVIGERIIDPKVIVSQITKLTKHRNADRLQLVTTNTGQEEITVVCGAPNISVGDIVPFSPVGTSLIDENNDQFTLKAAAIRGVASHGMINSPRELGLGDHHTGIYILPADAPVGDPLVKHLPNDTILDADITPNRAHDCLSHLGIAREIQALTGHSIVEPESIPIAKTSKLTDWQLTIADNNDVPRYLGVLLDQLTVKDSPLSIQAKLWSVGARPINNIVDITNYVAFEQGAPSHAFDASKLPAQNIGVRRARDQESIITLDGQDRTLTPDDSVIISDDKPVAIAGIMGGQSTEVDKHTNSIFLEVANFSAYPIQQSTARLKLPSEAATRHMKSRSPEQISPSAGRLAYLFQEFAGAKTIGRLDYYPHPAARSAIQFNPARVNKVSGLDIDEPTIADTLTSLRCKIDRSHNLWQVTPPADRLDLLAEHDLLEEAIRLHGLENITSNQPAILSDPIPLSDIARWREQLRDLLVSIGGNEIYSYSFDDENIRQLLNIPPNDNRLSLDNPPSPERQYLRDQLTPRLIGVALANKGELKRPSTKSERLLFEIESVFTSGKGRISGVQEEEHLALVLLGDRATVPEAQGIKSQILELLDLQDDAGLDISINEYASTDPIIKKLRLPLISIEINLTQLISRTDAVPIYQPESSNQAVQYKAPSKYPPVYRDLSIIVAPDVTVEQIQAIIENTGKKLVEDVDLFDEYVSDGQTSYAFHIKYQSYNQTLTDKDVESTHNNIVATLASELDTQLRE